MVGSQRRDVRVCILALRGNLLSIVDFTRCGVFLSALEETSDADHVRWS